MGRLSPVQDIDQIVGAGRLSGGSNTLIEFVAAERSPLNTGTLLHFCNCSNIHIDSMLCSYFLVPVVISLFL